ncbi:50S ribosomal protein L33 [Candidatus Saccharibacteria bacterium]|nr:50S ribosomal protein L33 [Candidatus Saccharibacteria bacterium]
MSKKTQEQIVILKNKETGSRYYTRKNPKNTVDKIELKKFDPKTRKVETFVEVKAKLK